jgi:hypothetical protein
MEKEIEMNAARAISVLIQGVEIAQQQGAFSLNDAELISKAVKFFRNANQPSAQPVASENAENENETEKPTRKRTNNGNTSK